jgi:chorismate dehydratase
VALAKIILSRSYGVEPECVSQRPEIEEMMQRADAALVIGDPALRVSPADYLVLDLAAEWRQMFGLPFVFAVWAVRSGIAADGLVPFFQNSLQMGLENLDGLIAEAEEQLELGPQELHEYLTVNLSFELGDEELAGLQKFYSIASEMDLIPAARPLRFLGACPSESDSVE